MNTLSDKCLNATFDAAKSLLNSVVSCNSGTQLLVHFGKDVVLVEVNIKFFRC